MPQFQMIERAPSFGEQLGAALGGGLSQGLSASLNSYLKGKQNTRALEGLKPFYEQAGLPMDKFNEFIQSGVEPQQAVALFKAAAEGLGPYRQVQQARLQADALMRQYSIRIKEAEKMLESPYMTKNKEERAQVVKLIEDLKRERDSVLGWSQQQNQQETSQTVQEQPIAPVQQAVSPKQSSQKKGAKPKFDNSNPEHVKKAQEYMKKYKDKEKVREELSKDFEGL